MGIKFYARNNGFNVPLLVIAWLAAVAIRLMNLDNIIIGWRPTELASIALNYYRHGFHFLYPQVQWGGNGPGFVEMECPLLPYGIALLYSVFGVHDFVAIALPMAFGLGLVVIVYLLAKYLFGTAEGFVAALFVIISPTWLELSTGIWPDPPTIFCGSVGIYLLTRWVDDDKWKRFFLAAFWISAAILFKLTSLFLGVPVLFLFWVKFKNRLFQSPRVWLFALLTLAVPLLWYFHSYRLFLEYHNTFGIIGGGYLKFGTHSILASPSFYALTFLRLMMYHVTPLGFLCMVFALVRFSGEPKQYLFHAWGISVLIYLAIAAKGVLMGHYQYILPVVPPAAAIAGLGTVKLFRTIQSIGRTRALLSHKVLAPLLMVLFIGNAVSSNTLYKTRDTVFSRLSIEKMRTGKAVRNLTASGSLIVVVDADMDDVTPEHSMTPPDVFYFGDRQGWYQSMAWITIDKIEKLRRQGARYLVFSSNDVGLFRREHADMYSTLSHNYLVLMDSKDGIIYDLWKSQKH